MRYAFLTGGEVAERSVVALAYLITSLVVFIVYSATPYVSLSTEAINGTSGVFSISATTTFSLTYYLGSMLLVSFLINIAYVWYSVHLWYSIEKDSLARLTEGDDRSLDVATGTTQVVVSWMLFPLVAHMCGPSSQWSFIFAGTSLGMFAATTFFLRFAAVAISSDDHATARGSIMKILGGNASTAVASVVALGAVCATNVFTFLSVVAGVSLAASTTVPPATVGALALVGIQLVYALSRALVDATVIVYGVTGDGASRFAKMYDSNGAYYVPILERWWFCGITVASTLLLTTTYGGATGLV